MADGFKRITDYDAILPANLPDDAVVYTVLPAESTPALIDRKWTWAGFKAWLMSYLGDDVVLNNTHRSSTGEDHTYIDQDVRSTASPTLNVLTLTQLESEKIKLANDQILTSSSTTQGAVYTAITDSMVPGSGAYAIRGAIVSAGNTYIVSSVSRTFNPTRLIFGCINAGTGSFTYLNIDSGSSSVVDAVALSW